MRGARRERRPFSRQDKPRTDETKGTDRGLRAHATSAKRLLRAGRGRLFGERPGCSCRTLLLLQRRRRRGRVMGRPSYSLPVSRCVSKRAASFTWLPTRCARQFPLPPLLLFRSTAKDDGFVTYHEESFGNRLFPPFLFLHLFSDVWILGLRRKTALLSRWPIFRTFRASYCEHTFVRAYVL